MIPGKTGIMKPIKNNIMDKVIIFIDHTMHSAWTNNNDAKKQVRTLVDNGYPNVYKKYIDHNYENGHYFI
jgi:hypothetical protein